ncbi:hypothetical protein QIT86_gp41 [Pseudomonas phage BUCT566]|uniref:Uncharacterized protein n=1 Tax=Pseudomonas phage BUCT566 TaxID=2829367 RepID=A0A8T8JGR2_9CAUD|nr:hypothetical protein QIT86_gp41 [Pseudomonas phage BUCT566]QUE30229.1 hypothetical protein [Pseudomonas phage BUCT566]
MSIELNKESVEQAGGDERAACNLWIAEQHLCQGSDISLFKLERNGALVSLHELLRDAYQAGQDRAALAQPSPAQAEQAEAERPEVVARVVHSNPVVLGQCGPLNANDELMTVAQHAASVARWAEMFNRVEQQRDAALAEVERLRESKGDPVGSLEKCMKVMYERDEHAKRLEAALARVAELEKELAMACDAAAKGDAARHAAGGMEMEIQELREKVTELQKELRSRWTYASTQATNCAGCGEYKHTPLRVDWMGGYVCLTCIDKKLEELHDDQAQHSVPEGWYYDAPSQVEAVIIDIRGMWGEDDCPTYEDVAAALRRLLAAAPGKEAV